MRPRTTPPASSHQHPGRMSSRPSAVSGTAGIRHRQPERDRAGRPRTCRRPSVETDRFPVGHRRRPQNPGQVRPQPGSNSFSSADRRKTPFRRQANTWHEPSGYGSLCRARVQSVQTAPRTSCRSCCDRFPPYRIPRQAPRTTPTHSPRQKPLPTTRAAHSWPGRDRHPAAMATFSSGNSVSCQ